MQKKRKQWWFNGVTGAVLLGSGLSIALECSNIKQDGGDILTWVFGGTAGIGLVLSGVVLLIRAGIINHELKTQQEDNK